MGTPKKKSVTNYVKQDCTSADNRAISYQVPFEVTDAALKKLFCYFLYHAPGIKSKHAEYLEQEQCEIILKKINERANQMIQFCESSVQIEKVLAKVNLSDKGPCLKCTRAMCKRSGVKKSPKESDLECLLRHIRNSIAHGYVCCRQSNKRYYILFEDYNDDGHMTAKIVCCKEDLEQWKEIISP